MKNIYKNQNISQTYKDQVVGSINFDSHATGATADTAITKPHIDPAKIQIEIEGQKNGRKWKIAGGVLYPIALACAFFKNAKWSLLWANSDNYATLKEVVDASGVKEIAITPMSIDLPCPVVLKGDDYIKSTTRVEADAIHSTADQSLTYLREYANPEIGNPATLPRIFSRPLEAGQTDFDEFLGNDVTGIFLVNTEKTGILTASRVWNSYTLSSDKLTIDRDYEQMLGDRCDQFETLAEANDRDQIFCIYKGIELDNVKLKLSLNSTNHNAGKSYLVVEYQHADGAVFQEAQKRAVKHQGKFFSKMKAVGVSR